MSKVFPGNWGGKFNPYYMYISGELRAHRVHRARRVPRAFPAYPAYRGHPDQGDVMEFGGKGDFRESKDLRDLVDQSDFPDYQVFQGKRARRVRQVPKVRKVILVRRVRRVPVEEDHRISTPASIFHYQYVIVCNNQIPIFFFLFTIADRYVFIFFSEHAEKEVSRRRSAWAQYCRGV